MVRIAVDAMGGDHAPGPEIDGALAAVREARAPAIEVILVGDEPRLRAEIAARGPLPPGITFHHASQVIAMDDHPSAAVKAKKDSSMRVGFDLVKRGEAQAIVSAGNSGAMMACGLFVLKRLRGVERPAIVTLAPTLRGRCVVLDVGANTELKPTALAQLGVIGATFARQLLSVARPRVAVLSNGEEESKGTELTRQTHRLLQGASSLTSADFAFAGYAEGRDIFGGELDVVVTDGFTGNVGLKIFEGAAQVIFDLLREEIGKSARAKLGAALLKPAFRALKRRIEPDEFGGAPLLGTDGTVVICHGRSTAKAMKNGILAAAAYASAGLTAAIEQAIERHQSLWSPGDDPPLKSAAD